VTLTIAFCIESVTFTAGVIRGTESLGGSESACLGLARALKARGHDVHIFTTMLGEDAPAVDHAGVKWHHARDIGRMSILCDWDVFVALRMPIVLSQVKARFRVLWNQDLLNGEGMKNHVMSQAWAYDALAYVSEYHRHQWEGLCEEVRGIGYVTRNGFDQTLVHDPKTVHKAPNRIIHISRPERGLGPLLTMWPLLRAKVPDAELHLCRYSSMYDAQGWGKVCSQYDASVAQINAQVGGIKYLGELGKPALYKAIGEAAVMWYPGVHDFAETSCIAAIEAQANGTPFVGSYKGALPETAPHGIYIKGNADTDADYHQASVAAVVDLLNGCRNQTFAYRKLVQAGRDHVFPRYTYEAIASDWEQWLLAQFRARYKGHTLGVLRQLMHEDDVVAALTVASEIARESGHDDEGAVAFALAVSNEAHAIISGHAHTSADYGDHAPDPMHEVHAAGGRIQEVLRRMADRKHVVDVACGSGAFALALAEADPARTVVGIDFSQANIDAANLAATKLGISDRVTFICASVWDFATQQPSEWMTDFVTRSAGVFDGLWCGEFLEHVAEVKHLVDLLETLVIEGGTVMCSVPMGPQGELVDRRTPHLKGHVHHFRPADLAEVFGRKRDFTCSAAPGGTTPCGNLIGNWILQWTNALEAPTGDRPLDRVVLMRPKRTLSAGIITNDTLDLRRCLDAIWPVVDEIVIGDCGAPAGELDAICHEFPRKTRVVPVGPVPSLRGGFSEARNVVMDAATGDWFLWIDSDEVLCGGVDLQKYTESIVFRGFSVKQQNLHLDAPMDSETPIRLFRRGPDIRFYGCIHEQPQMGHCNGDIVPALQVGDFQLAHTGYLHENIRREKAITRNLPLLSRDREVFKERTLGLLLVTRDFANLALWEKQQAGGQLTDQAKEYQRNVIALYEQHFLDPGHKYHGLARPFYESALRDVAGAMEIEVALAGAPQGLGNQRAPIQRLWVRTPAHLRQLLQARIDEMLKPIEQPFAMDVEPLPQADHVPTENAHAHL
jgi:2-polyprenyl-3-methyl-5-hydroxy-6-metoxy-1,4-benzoquinol methylase/glycosyltransferase involved in cell wall biosynthesis